MDFFVLTGQKWRRALVSVVHVFGILACTDTSCFVAGGGTLWKSIYDTITMKWFPVAPIKCIEKERTQLSRCKLVKYKEKLVLHCFGFVWKVWFTEKTLKENSSEKKKVFNNNLQSSIVNTFLLHFQFFWIFEFTIRCQYRL